MSQDALNLHRLALQTKLQLTEDVEEVPDVKTQIQVGFQTARTYRLRQICVIVALLTEDG